MTKRKTKPEPPLDRQGPRPDVRCSMSSKPARRRAGFEEREKMRRMKALRDRCQHFVGGLCARNFGRGLGPCLLVEAGEAARLPECPEGKKT